MFIINEKEQIYMKVLFKCCILTSGFRRILLLFLLSIQKDKTRLIVRLNWLVGFSNEGISNNVRNEIIFSYLDAIEN